MLREPVTLIGRGIEPPPTCDHLALDTIKGIAAGLKPLMVDTLAYLLNQ
jgi:hypothetical protein